jgi:hypothetical protein
VHNLSTFSYTAINSRDAKMMVLNACKACFLDTRPPKIIGVNIPNQYQSVKGRRIQGMYSRCLLCYLALCIMPLIVLKSHCVMYGAKYYLFKGIYSIRSIVSV